MRYILGVKIYNKENKETTEGLTVFDCIGYPASKSIEAINESLKDGKTVKTRIYNTIEEAQKAISEYTKNFRRDDVWKSQQTWMKSKYIITFYPIKIDNNKFPFCVKETDEKTKKGDKVFAFVKKEKKGR